MNTEIQTINDSERKISIEMPQEETQKYFEEILRKEAKKLTIPGFRKGKAPLSIVKKMYGEALFYDNLDKIAQNKFWDEMDSQGIEVLGIPKLTDIDLKENGGLKFEIQFEVLPKIEIENIEGIEIQKEEFEISEKFVEDMVEYVRFELRNEIADEKVQSMEYIVTLEKGIRSDTEIKSLEKIPVYLKNQTINQEFVNLILNKNLNDEFETDIPLTKDTKETEPQNKQEKQTYNYKVVEIKQVILPEINDELAQKYSNGKISTLEELKRSLVDAETSYYKNQEEINLRKAIRDAFVEKFNFTPPPSLVEKQLKFLEEDLKKKYNVNELPTSIQTQLKELALKDVQWYLISNHLKTKFNLRLTEEEINSYAQNMAEKSNIDKEKVLKYLYSNKSSLIEQLESDKLYKFILSNIKVIPKKVII